MPNATPKVMNMETHIGPFSISRPKDFINMRILHCSPAQDKGEFRKQKVLDPDAYVVLLKTRASSQAVPSPLCGPLGP